MKHICDCGATYSSTSALIACAANNHGQPVSKAPDSRQFDLKTPHKEPHVFIQWKGTDACFDFHCQCGHHAHFDGMFAYHVKCGGCGAVYALPSNLFMRRLTDAEAAEVRPIVMKDED